VLHLSEAVSGTTGETVAPIIVALVTAAVAIVAPRLRSPADDLKRASTLSALLTEMPESPERGLIAELRDDYAVTWALRDAAPTPAWPGRAGRLAYGAGVVVLLAGALHLLLLAGYQWWFWLYYLAGAVLLVAGAVLGRVDASRRRTWMRAELERRGLRMPRHGRLREVFARDGERAPGSRPRR